MADDPQAAPRGGHDGAERPRADHEGEISAATSGRPTTPPHDAEANGLQPLLAEALGSAVRKLLYRSRTEISRAARTGRERLELRQLQRDLDHFWVRLGKSAYHLVQGGEIDHPALRKAMDRIDELEAKIDDLRRGRAGVSEESSD